MIQCAVVVTGHRLMYEYALINAFQLILVGVNILASPADLLACLECFMLAMLVDMMAY